MQEKKIYIKIEQNIEVCNKKIYLGDIAKIYSDDSKMVKDLNRTEFMSIDSTKNTKYMVSILKVIELISKKYPNCEISNVGENDFIISYVLPEKKGKKWEYIKVGLVSCVILIGSAFTIMTFNEEVSIQDLFGKIYELTLGDKKQGNRVLELSYSIGLPIGICVFFNHFSRRATHNDPTPLQVEMRIYEEEENRAMIKNASREGKTLDAH